MRHLLIILMGCLRPLSERSVAAVARGLSYVWFWGLRYRRRTVLSNLRHLVDGPKERARLARRVFEHYLLTLCEFLRLPKYLSEGVERTVQIEGLKHLQAAQAQGKGVLVLSGHLGAFELGLAAAAQAIGPVFAVVKRFSPGVDRLVSQLREDAGIHLIKPQGAMKRTLGALKQDGIVAFVLDQNATRSTGVFVDFFGKSACTLSTLAVLQLKTGAPVVAATAQRLSPGRHVLRIHPPIPLQREATRAQTVQAMTQRYTSFLEAQIRACPSQWFWAHKRWRTRPKPSKSSPHSSGA